jgi:hypothetical protein
VRKFEKKKKKKKKKNFEKCMKKSVILVIFHPGHLFANFSSMATARSPSIKWQLSRWAVAFLQSAAATSADPGRA